MIYQFFGGSILSNNILSNLEPKSVFNYFEQICSIPHGSRNTKQISDFCVSFAKEHNLKYSQDESNNIIIWKDGTQQHLKYNWDCIHQKLAQEEKDI